MAVYLVVKKKFHADADSHIFALPIPSCGLILWF